MRLILLSLEQRIGIRILISIRRFIVEARSKKWEVKFIFGILSVIFIVTFVSAQENTYDEAIEAYKKGDFMNAAKYLKEYVEKNPDPNAYYLLGYASYKMKNYSESIRYFKEAYDLDPNLSYFLVK